MLICLPSSQEPEFQTFPLENESRGNSVSVQAVKVRGQKTLHQGLPVQFPYELFTESRTCPYSGHRQPSVSAVLSLI